jgi:hypothetical protein
MRFNVAAAAVASVAMLSGNAYAEDVKDESSSSSTSTATPSASKVAPKMATFTVSTTQSSNCYPFCARLAHLRWTGGQQLAGAAFQHGR